MLSVLNLDEKEIGVENIKWKDFYEFNLNPINDPKALFREASQKYTISLL